MPPPDPASREEEIFTAALAKPAAERAALLAAACAGDERLAANVAALLAAYDRAPAFLDASPAATAAALAAAKPGDRIGRYKLVSKLGEGGCGSVHLAEQEEPVRRTVALKIIKLGMDTAAVIARFEAERQALALMDHPNIARVFDAGATDAGRPYFVMELVRGVPIGRFCDEERLPIAERLRLFIQVCHAIQHAHQKGIVHRDLKPSNILVARHDGTVVPKVIDFGVAKATQGRLTEHAATTADTQVIGTPAYMSPEQAALNSADIDTRSDIYSLGVLLYELLAGRAPFEARELWRIGWDEVRRHIREVEPPRPSARLAALPQAELAAAAQQRHTTPARLVKMVRGDLDWIVLRCLEKERQRRYQTANDLAADLQRYLEHEPVAARPPTAAYRLQKTIQRHRVAFAAGAIVALSMVSGLAVSMVLLVRERAERERAVVAEREQTRLRAQTELARASEATLRGQAEANEKASATEAARSAQVARFLQDLLKGAGPRVALGRDTKLLHDILDDTAGRLGRELAAQPLVEAQLRLTLGDTYNDLGDYRSGIAMFEAALALQRRALGNEHAAVAATLVKLGGAVATEGRLPEAENRLREALAIQRKLAGAGGCPAARPLARTLVLRGKAGEGEALLRETIAMERQRSDAPLALADTLDAFAYVLSLEGRLSEAEAARSEEFALRRRLQNDDDEAMAKVLLAFGELLGAERKFSLAEVVWREALARQRRRAAGAHPDLADCLDGFAGLLREEGSLAEAEAVCREALAMRRQLLGDTHPQVAASWRHLGMVLAARERWEEAESPLRQARAIEREQHLDLQALSSLPWLLDVLEHCGRTAEAMAVCRELLAAQRRAYDRDNGLIAATLTRLGRLLRSGGQPDAAGACEREAAGLRAAAVGPELARGVGEAGASRSLVLLQQVRLAEAESVGRDELAQARAHHGMESREAALALDTLGAIQAREERWVEAEVTAREALALWQRLRGRDDGQVAMAGATLGKVLLRAGRPADAEPSLRDALAIARRLQLAETTAIRQDLVEVLRLLHQESAIADLDRG